MERKGEREREIYIYIYVHMYIYIHIIDIEFEGRIIHVCMHASMYNMYYHISSLHMPRSRQDGSWQRFFTSSHLPQFALASSASGYTQKVADLLESMAEWLGHGSSSEVFLDGLMGTHRNS